VREREMGKSWELDSDLEIEFLSARLPVHVTACREKILLPSSGLKSKPNKNPADRYLSFPSASIAFLLGCFSTLKDTICSSETLGYLRNCGVTFILGGADVTEARSSRVLMSTLWTVD
jgi:hypothetical protein